MALSGCGGKDRLSPERLMSGVATVSAGQYHSMILKADGTLLACGKNQFGQLGDGTRAGSSSFRKVMSRVGAVAPGYAHTLVLRTDGSAWAMGVNVRGELGIGTAETSEKPVRIRLP